ncbi:hypothetical protein L6164_014246 [Bauhinia variegata]|uniref:Uncharacterized protein n=1 Tax=Bauhinia variegata TaxID=167791 RepID=A0ACB9NIN7_BAUVA|nr:hypothetical protein L6164_014246 [Bauhinia variegata]
MAFDQNSISRPINVTPTIAEEKLISPNNFFDVSSPGVPLFYAQSASDNGFVSVSYGNVPTVSAIRTGVPIGHPTMTTAVGLSYSPNFVNRVGGGNALDLPSAVPTATGYPSNLGNWVVGNKTGNGAVDRLGCTALQGSRVIDNASDQIGNISPTGIAYSPTIHRLATVNGANQGSEEGGDDSVSGKKIKFLCSYGGKILPRPSDGMLRYVGGLTRIISFKRDVSFNELVQKMTEIYGQPVVIKYQLPNEDLDALISVSCPDDLENMLDEYAKLIEQSPDGSAKLRLFLFSASELDASGVIQFGDLHDSGQRYVDAVNGITDVISGGMKRESIASAASTQNSDLSGTEVIDSSIPGQGEVSGAPKSSMLSPKGNLAASHDIVAKSVVGDHATAVCSEASSIPSGISTAISGSSYPSTFQNEVELESCVPLTLYQQQIGSKQTGMDIPPPAPYLQPLLDPYPDVMNHAGYVQPPPQVGFLNPQLLGNGGPAVFTQPQFYDSSSGLASHQVIPTVHMTMNTPSSHVGVRPNVLQPVMQPVQNHLDQYSDESISASKIAYQVPMVAGGEYGWVQVPAQEHAIFPDGLLAHQKVMIPEKVQKVEDGYMCQKTLPHAHSDPVAQNQRDNGSATSSDSIPSYHSLPMQENLKALAINQVMVTAPLKEAVNEQGVGTKPRVVSKVEPRVPFADTTELSHNLERQPEQDGHSAIMVTTPVSLDDVYQPCTVPVENLVKQGIVQSNAVYDGIPSMGVTTIGNSEYMVQGFPKEYTNQLAGFVAKADAADNCVMHDHRRPINGRMDTHGVYNPEVQVSNDKYKLPVDKEVLLDNNFGRSKIVLDANEAAQPSPWGIPGLNPLSTSVNHHKDDIVPTSLSPSGRLGDVQDSSNSLFSNKDPWNMHHETYFPPPPRPNKVPMKKETCSSKNYFTENLLGNCEEQKLEAQMEDALCEPFKQNLILEQGSVEDHIKQELQAVAEGVAASVLQSSNPSIHELHVANVSGNEESGQGDVENNLTDKQSIAANAQDVNSKPQETANLGFPTSDSIGKLQVIKNCDLEELRELGSGTFGTVYHGKWRGTDVAIKRINDRCFAGKASEQERMRADFWNEAIKLADLHHPNVVAFYGVVLDGPGGSVATVTEFMVNGSLRNALQKNERNLDKRKRILIAMDVAFGMEYLHGKNIVHFDLKSDNLLVNLRDPHRPICKVGDLGLSKVKRQTLISGGVRGTLPWMAPELLNGSSSLVSEKVDVFSFGIVMWELLTGEEPYADLHYGAIIGGIVSNTLRPAVPESCDPEWKSLMERCWSSDTSERPSFTEIANQLRSMAAKIPPKGQTQQQQHA